MFRKLAKILLNKYFITLVIFAAWMVFFDSNNVMNRRKLNSKLQELQQEKKFYLDAIRHDSIQNLELMTDSLELEKFAREKYLMKKDNEDLFLIIDTTADPRR
jgi:cell division protein DivIC